MEVPSTPGSPRCNSWAIYRRTNPSPATLTLYRRTNPSPATLTLYRRTNPSPATLTPTRHAAAASDPNFSHALPHLDCALSSR